MKFVFNFIFVFICFLFFDLFVYAQILDETRTQVNVLGGVITMSTQGAFDVDGNDLLVLEGAKKLLHEDSVKEIFVEIDDKIYINNEIENFMKKYPYKIKNDIDVGTIHKPMRMVLYVRD